MTFETTPLNARAAVDMQRRALAELRRAIHDDYSHRERLRLDWDALVADHAPRLLAAPGPLSFALAAQELLAKASDIHITLHIGERTLPTHAFTPKRNYNLALLARLVPGFRRQSDAVFTGRFPDGPGYLLVAHFFRSGPSLLEPAYALLAELDEARGLILDVRPNAGGNERLTRELAGCFVDRPAVYAKVLPRDCHAPGGFGPPVEHVVAPGGEISASG